MARLKLSTHVILAMTGMVGAIVLLASHNLVSMWIILIAGVGVAVIQEVFD